MDRETTLLTTSNGHQIELKTYITGREKRAINEVFFREMEMRQKGNEHEISGIKGSVTFEAENKTFESVIQSITPANRERITEKKAMIDFLLDLPVDEYETVVAAVNEISNPKKAGATS
jgi:hypothetical protein